MNIGRAVGIVKNISSENVTGNVTNEEVALAIYDVMNMPTLNSVSKYELVKVMQWLWHQAFRFEDEEGADNGNEQNAEIEDYSHNNRGMTRDIRELQKALEQAKSDNKMLKQNLEEAHIDIRERLAEIESLTKKYEMAVAEREANVKGFTAEIERLQELLDSKCDRCIERDKAEATKEFAERLKDAICENTYPSFDKDGKPVNIWKAKSGYDVIDNIVKEMVGDDGGSSEKVQMAGDRI